MGGDGHRTPQEMSVTNFPRVILIKASRLADGPVLIPAGALGPDGIVKTVLRDEDYEWEESSREADERRQEAYDQVEWGRENPGRPK